MRSMLPLHLVFLGSREKHFVSAVINDSDPSKRAQEVFSYIHAALSPCPFEVLLLVLLHTWAGGHTAA